MSFQNTAFQNTAFQIALSLNLGAAIPVEMPDFPPWRVPSQISGTPFALARASVPAPFFQVDWPNPRGSVPGIDLRTHVDTPNWALYASVGPGASSEIAGATYPTWTPPSQISGTPYALANQPTAVPFIQGDWPNPKGRPPLVVGFANGFPPPLTTVAPPSIQRDWPNPRGPKPVVADWIQGTPAIAIGSLKPFAQDDWPNPIPPRRGPADWIQGTPASNLGSLKPFVQDDWPNPRGAKPVVADQQKGFQLTLTTIIPANQYNWPNPAGPRRSGDLGWYGSGLSLSTVVVYPATITFDWPNPPRGARPPVTDWQTKFPLTLTTIKPVSQYDWQNPAGSRRSVDLLTQTNFWRGLTATPVAPPSSLKDWPNPRGPKPVAADWFKPVPQALYAVRTRPAPVFVSDLRYRRPPVDWFQRPAVPPPVAGLPCEIVGPTFRVWYDTNYVYQGTIVLGFPVVVHFDEDRVACVPLLSRIAVVPLESRTAVIDVASRTVVIPETIPCHDEET